MPKKSNGHNLFTKDFLEEKLDELGNKIDRKLVGIQGKIDVKLEMLKEEIDENAKNYRDQILTKMDDVMSELEAGRQERSLETNQYSGIVEQVDDHEKRIKSLEHVQKAA